MEEWMDVDTREGIEVGWRMRGRRKEVMVLWALMTMTCVAASHTDFSGEFGFVKRRL